MKRARTGSAKHLGTGKGSWPGREDMVRWLTMLLALITLAGWSPPQASAKQKKPPTRTITGAVLDSSDNPIVGATIELTDDETGKKLDIYSESAGRYRFSDLNPTHDYEVQANYKGRSSETRRASSLDDSSTLVLDLRISSGSPP